MATTLKEKLAKFAEDGEHKEVLDIVDKSKFSHHDIVVPSNKSRFE